MATTQQTEDPLASHLYQLAQAIPSLAVIKTTYYKDDFSRDSDVMAYDDNGAVLPLLDPEEDLLYAVLHYHRSLLPEYWEIGAGTGILVTNLRTKVTTVDHYQQGLTPPIHQRWSLSNDKISAVEVDYLPWEIACLQALQLSTTTPRAIAADKAEEYGWQQMAAMLRDPLQFLENHHKELPDLDIA